MVCPNAWLMLGLISRVMTSRFPPGGYGTMIVMGREGYVACAKAVAGRQMQDMNASAIVRRMITDVFLPCFFDSCFMECGCRRPAPLNKGMPRRLGGCCRQNPVTPSQV